MRIIDKAGVCQFEAIKKEDGAVEYKFYDKALEKDLSNGIHIPDYAKNNYQGRTYVKVNEPGFLAALQSFYVKNVLGKGYKWEE